MESKQGRKGRGEGEVTLVVIVGLEVGGLFDCCGNLIRGPHFAGAVWRGTGCHCYIDGIGIPLCYRRCGVIPGDGRC